MDYEDDLETVKNGEVPSVHKSESRASRISPAPPVA